VLLDDEVQPQIAILGWGSLLWEDCPEFDKWHDNCAFRPSGTMFESMWHPFFTVLVLPIVSFGSRTAGMFVAARAG
jgi:hypothetical protein